MIIQLRSFFSLQIFIQYHDGDLPKAMIYNADLMGVIYQRKTERSKTKRKTTYEMKAERFKKEEKKTKRNNNIMVEQKNL